MKCALQALKACSPYSRNDRRTCFRRCFEQGFKAVNILIANIFFCERSILVIIRAILRQIHIWRVKRHVRKPVLAILVTYVEIRLWSLIVTKFSQKKVAHPTLRLVTCTTCSINSNVFWGQGSQEVIFLFLMKISTPGATYLNVFKCIFYSFENLMVSRCIIFIYLNNP